MNKIIQNIGLVLLGIVLVFLFVREDKVVQGSAPSGLASAYATASQVQLVGGGNPVLLFNAATSTCAARIIKTASTSIEVSIGTTTASGAYLDPVNGLGQVFQLATSSVVYDGGTYGCGEWWATPTQDNLAGPKIIVTETR